jgi:hypothetical protein
MVDEVHLVMDWGLTFRESYTHLKYLRNLCYYLHQVPIPFDLGQPLVLGFPLFDSGNPPLLFG